MGTKRENVRYEAAAGRPGRLLIVRLRSGSDLINGIIQVCDDYGIKNGYIASCIGSLYNSKFTYGRQDESLKSRAGFSPEQETNHLTEFVAGQGSICHNEQGEVQIHFHALFNDNGFLRGGHFDKPGNIIGTTMEIAIQEVEGVSMTRPFDSEIDQNHLQPAVVDVN